MTEQTIPAGKVRELIEHFEGKDIGIESYGILGRFRALLPAPPQPTGGLLGRWAKHPEHGEVMCVWDKPMGGRITVWYRNENSPTGSLYDQVPLADLTFPEQAMKPEDVPAGEAWLVNLNGGKHTRVVALKASGDTWRIGRSDSIVTLWRDEFVELIAPLVPERPASDLQAKYDALEDKYREAQEKIEALSQASTPRTVTTEAEYAALPEGSMIVDADDDVWRKVLSGNWIQEVSYQMLSDAKLSGTTRTVLRYGWGDEQPSTPRTVRAPEEYDALPIGSRVQSSGYPVVQKGDDGLWRTDGGLSTFRLHAGVKRTVLRYGWGDEQPAWRIEHDHTNLRVGDYIIDYVDDYGTVENIAETGTRYTDGNALGKQRFAPFIVFPNRDAATPEAVDEAKKARDKETGE